MPVPIDRLALTVEKRRGAEPPVHAGRFEWEEHELPGRAYFMASVEAAYETIELPWFPHRAYVEITVDRTRPTSRRANRRTRPRWACSSGTRR